MYIVQKIYEKNANIVYIVFPVCGVPYTEMQKKKKKKQFKCKIPEPGLRGGAEYIHIYVYTNIYQKAGISVLFTLCAPSFSPHTCIAARYPSVIEAS